MITVQTNIERERAQIFQLHSHKKRKKLKIVTGEITSVGRKKRKRETKTEIWKKKLNFAAKDIKTHKRRESEERETSIVCVCLPKMSLENEKVKIVDLYRKWRNYYFFLLSSTFFQNQIEKNINWFDFSLIKIVVLSRIWPFLKLPLGSPLTWKFRSEQSRCESSSSPPQRTLDLVMCPMWQVLCK